MLAIAQYGMSALATDNWQMSVRTKKLRATGGAHGPSRGLQLFCKRSCFVFVCSAAFASDICSDSAPRKPQNAARGSGAFVQDCLL